MNKSPEDLLFEVGITPDLDLQGSAELNGRKIRYLPDLGLLQIGDLDFDRWANSVALEFELWLPKGQRQFLRCLEETTK